MKISIIIPYYNAKKFIIETVESVINQTYKNIEIIIVDDGSNDNVEKILKDYIASKKLTLIKKKNGGPASARNIGIKYASGDLIAFLDADDIWLPEKLEKQISLVNKHKKPIITFTRKFFLVNNKSVNENEKLYQGEIYKKLLKSNFITNSSVIIDKKIINDIGLLNESKELVGVEDYEYWLRASKKYNFYFVDEPLVKYRTHNDQLTKRTKSNILTSLLLNELKNNLFPKNIIFNIYYLIKLHIYNFKK